MKELFVGVTILFSLMQLSYCELNPDDVKHLPQSLLRILSSQLSKSGIQQKVDQDTQAAPQPCCFPKIWQGQLYFYLSGDDAEYGVVVYEDDSKEHYAGDITITPTGSTTPTKLSQLFQMDDAHKIANVYEYDKVSKQCIRGQIQNITYDDLTGRCIPQNANFAGVFNLGIAKGGSSLPLSSWMWYPAPTEEPKVRFERLVTSDCAPTLQILFGDESTGMPILEADYFLNIQTSIDDQTVFDLPSYCQQIPVTRRWLVSGPQDLLKFRLGKRFFFP